MTVDVVFEPTDAGSYGVTAWTPEGETALDGDFRFMTATHAAELRARLEKRGMVTLGMGMQDCPPYGVMPTGNKTAENGIVYHEFVRDLEVFWLAVRGGEMRTWWRIMWS